MSEIEPEAVVAYIEQHTETSPPNDAGDPSSLWDGYDEMDLGEEMGDLWRWGIIEAELRDGEQYVKLSEFGEELNEKGFADMYIHAKNGEVPFEDSMDERPAVRVLE